MIDELLDPALREAISAELARRSFTDLAARMDPRFEDPPAHLSLMLRELDKLERGENDYRFLIFNIAPRHAKTTVASILFPIYLLGRDPTRQIILASHSADLAETQSRIARDLIQQESWPFRTRLSEDSTAVNRWHVKEGGSLRSLSLSGNIRGRGADFLLIDDPVNDGASKIECEAAYRWFSEIAFNRLNKGGRVVISGQRLAEYDPFGRILESELGPKFRVISVPAIAEETDPLLGRSPGEALWPSQFPLEELEIQRVAMGTRQFEAQYQQRPASETGGMLHRSWFEEFTYDTPPRYGRVITAIDCASKTGVHNDWSALVTVMLHERRLYVLDVVRRKVEFFDLIQCVEETYRRNHPDVIYIEGASAGFAISQELKRASMLPVVEVPPRGSKMARVESITGLLESGRILFPRNAPWLDAFVDECVRFSDVCRHDDQVDAFALAVAQAIEYAAYYEQQHRPLRFSTQR